MNDGLGACSSSECVWLPRPNAAGLAELRFAIDRLDCYGILSNFFRRNALDFVCAGLLAVARAGNKSLLPILQYTSVY